MVSRDRGEKCLQVHSFGVTQGHNVTFAVHAFFIPARLVVCTLLVICNCDALPWAGVVHSIDVGDAGVPVVSRLHILQYPVGHIKILGGGVPVIDKLLLGRCRPQTH